MEIDFRPGRRDNQLVVVLVGDLDLYASVAFCNAVMARLGAGANHLVLDFAGVRYLDSSGVGALIRLIQKARAAGGEVRLAALGGTPRKVLEMSNIITLVRVSADVASALEAWS